MRAIGIILQARLYMGLLVELVQSIIHMRRASLDLSVGHAGMVGEDGKRQICVISTYESVVETH